MRKSCWSCVIKHLGSAAVYDSEIKHYPDFQIYLIGELHHASLECEEVNPDLADVLRVWRIFKDGRHGTANIPYEGLYNYIDICRSIDSGNNELSPGEVKIPYPDVPDELKFKGELIDPYTME